MQPNQEANKQMGTRRVAPAIGVQWGWAEYRHNWCGSARALLQHRITRRWAPRPERRADHATVLFCSAANRILMSLVSP